MSKRYTVHVDIDSPITLSKFYNVKLNGYDITKLEAFYEKTFERMLATFDKLNIKATFFCVASEVERSEKIKDVLISAIKRGHFIGNHTYSHPFGMSELNPEEINAEIEKANNILKEKLDIIPLGFRSPNFVINTDIINTLEKNNIAYDSSAGWPIFHIIFRIMRYLNIGIMKVGFGETNSRLRKKVYLPDKSNWKRNSQPERKISEYPLPASCYLLPCYSNFHLTFNLKIVRFLLNNTRRNELLIYLMHAIEFSSVEDDFVPKEILVHPHLRMNMTNKLHKIDLILSYIHTKRAPYSIEGEMIGQHTQ